MAKSLRSKIKRAHRTELRKAYSQPIMNKRQKKISDELKKEIKAKQGGSLFKLANQLKEGNEMEEEDNDDEENEDAEGDKGENKEYEVKSLPFSEPKGGSMQKAAGGGRQGVKRSAGPQEAIMERLKEKKKGSKPRLASAKKQFTWFK